MKEPEVVYCKVINSEKGVQPPPLPKRRENIAASFIDLNSAERIPPPINFTVNRCQRSQNSSSWKRQVVLTIAATIFAIISMVFMSLYFNAEAKMTKCSGNTGKNTAYHIPSLFPVNTVLYLLPVCSECGECSQCRLKKEDAFIMGKIKNKRQAVRPMFVCDMHCLTQLIDFKNSSCTRSWFCLYYYAKNF